MTKKLKAAAFQNIHTLAQLQSSPQQKQVLYTVCNAVLDSDNYTYQLWKYDGQNHEVVLSHDSALLFAWLNEDEVVVKYEKTLADHQKKAEFATVFYRLNVHTKQLKFLATLPFPIESIENVNNQYFVVAAFLNDFLWKCATRTARKRKLKQKITSFTAFAELPFYDNQGGFIQQRKRTVFRVDAKTFAYTALTDRDFDVSRTVIAPTLDSLYVIGQQALGAIKGNNSQILHIDLTGDQPSTLFSDPRYDVQALYHVGSQLYVAATDHEHWGFIELPKIYRLVNGTLVLTEDTDLDFLLNLDLSQTASKLTLVALKGYYSALWRLNPAAKFELIGEFSGLITDATVLKDQVVFIASKKDELSEIFSADATWQTIAKVSSHNQSFLQPNTVATQPFVVGNIDGWVLAPVGFNPNKRYPAILYIHGGPHGLFSDGYDFNAQLLANQGYFVCFANPRGSSGKGNLFAELREKTGEYDYQDLTVFLDAVIDAYPQIDQTRLGITGISYGGYLTNWFVTQTGRFKSAISENGVSNWLSQSTTSDIGYGYVQHYSGDPLTKADSAWAHSPLKYVSKVTTPVLFIHSDEDYRCPVAEGYQFYTQVKRLGLETKFLLFHHENHGFSRTGRPTNRLMRYQAMIDWFAKTLD